MTVNVALLFAAAISLSPPMHVTLHAPHALLHLEVAATETTREYGLMNRTFLAPHTGMLFVFERDAEVTFWMKDTLVPLDMVFLSGSGRVRSVAAGVPASTADMPDAQIARRRAKARYVLELPAGEARRDGLRPGTIVHWEATAR